MNITRENISELNAVLKIDIVKADYDEKVENVLRDYRKKANIKGFRPGMVPIGVVKKIYGRAVRIDEINKVVTEGIQKYISDEKLEILGDPLPVESEHERLDFDNQDDFSFSFELGLAPSFEINLSKKTKVTQYEIAIDEKMRNDYLNNYKRRFGELRNAENVESKDVVKGKIEAVDDSENTLADGAMAEETSLSIDIIKDEKIQNDFLGKALNESVVFEIRKAFPNDNEIAGILRKKKEEVSGIDGKFRFTVSEISRFHPAETGQELFDRIYGEGVVTSEEEFMNKLDAEISSNLARESDYKLMTDLKALATEKTEFDLPGEFLKKWLLKVNENTTGEQIEKEFGSFAKDLKWQLIRNKVARDNSVKITEEELLQEAKNITRYQFSQYGLFYASDEQITNYARETLKREDDAKRIADKILEEKVIALLKEAVKLEPKSISVEDFNKLFE
jgi:trigger factor